MHKYFLTFCILYLNFSFAQSFKYRNYKFDWPANKPESIQLNEAFNKEDAVILEEKCIYNQGGNKTSAYYTMNVLANYLFVGESDQGITPVVQKHVRIKFLTQRGIDRYGRFVLPESFDPSNDQYSIPPATLNAP